MKPLAIIGAITIAYCAGCFAYEAWLVRKSRRQIWEA